MAGGHARAAVGAQAGRRDRCRGRRAVGRARSRRQTCRRPPARRRWAGSSRRGCDRRRGREVRRRRGSVPGHAHRAASRRRRRLARPSGWVGSGIQIIMRHSHIPGLRCDLAGLEGPSGRSPRGQAAVQNADVREPGRGQHPPCSRRTGTIPVVVDHDQRVLPDTPSACGGLQVASRWQRVTATPGDGVIAEFVLEGHVHRAR